MSKRVGPGQRAAGKMPHTLPAATICSSGSPSIRKRLDRMAVFLRVINPPIGLVATGLQSSCPSSHTLASSAKHWFDSGRIVAHSLPRNSRRSFGKNSRGYRSLISAGFEPPALFRKDGPMVAQWQEPHKKVRYSPARTRTGTHVCLGGGGGEQELKIWKGAGSS